MRLRKSRFVADLIFSPAAFRFLDTDGKQVISSIKQRGAIDTHALFTATVEEYMQAYGRTYEIPKAPSYRQKVEGWAALADTLAHQPEATQWLLQAIRERRPDPLELSVDVRAEQLMLQLADLRAVRLLGKGSRKLRYGLGIVNLIEIVEFV